MDYAPTATNASGVGDDDGRASVMTVVGMSLYGTADGARCAATIMSPRGPVLMFREDPVCRSLAPSANRVAYMQ